MVVKTITYPGIAIPPGQYLAEEIGARSISQKELAKLTGRPLNVINETINGKKAVTLIQALNIVIDIVMACCYTGNRGG